MSATSTFIEGRTQRRIRMDWLLYVLAIGATVCLPLDLQVSGWLPEAEHLLLAALCGCMLGLLLARSRMSDPWAWLSGIGLGLGYALQFVGNFVPPGPMIVGDLQRVWDWLIKLVIDGYYDPQLPLSFGATYFCTQADNLFQKLTAWTAVVRAGGMSTDNTALLLGVWFAVWVMSWNAAFQLGRHRRAVAALVPLGLALFASVGFTGLGIEYARIYLGLALVAFMWANSGRMQMLWMRTGVGVAAGLRRHVFLTGIPLAGLVLVFALFMPYITYDRSVRYFWDHMGDRVRNFYQQMDRAFAGRNPLRKTVVEVVTRLASQPGTGGSLDNLQEHDVRVGAPNSDDVIFTVRTSDAASEQGQSPPLHYWRERTYDAYTGSGWTNSETRSASFAANAIWKEIGYPHTVLTQTFSLQWPMGLSLAVNEPVVAAEDYSLRTRGPGDLAAFYTAAQTYTVVSMVPDATVPELRSAQQEYADWVREEFLALPAVPNRIQRLAQRIVRQARARTRYDQAKAIEAYLRGFTYDLQIEPPADGVDVVDYYLFTTQRGYCDYAATAMVVMLRSLGVAARYASGYGPGTYDPLRDAWMVTGQNAHAWVEVYFPGYGWIEFEPTPSQGLLIRNEVRPTPQPAPTAMPTPLAPVQPTPPAAGAAPTQPPDSQQSGAGPAVASRGRNLLLSLLAAGGLLLGLAYALVRSGMRGARAIRDPKQIIRLVYEQLLRRAHHLGISPGDGHTPREFLRDFATRVAQRSGMTIEVSQDIATIRQLYERACYSEDSLTLSDGERVRMAWERLSRSLKRQTFLSGGKGVA